MQFLVNLFKICVNAKQMGVVPNSVHITKIVWTFEKENAVIKYTFYFRQYYEFQIYEYSFSLANCTKLMETVSLVMIKFQNIFCYDVK